MPNNTCAEETIKKAFELVCNRRIDFNPTMANDTQIDISPALIASEGACHVFFTGQQSETLAATIATLNKQKVYFLRSGIAGGAGHWQLLYFSQNNTHWISFSSATNSYSCTQQDGSLTEAACNALVVPFATWGLNQGNYSLTVQEATRDRVIACANYISDYRCSPSDTPDTDALDKLYEYNSHTELRGSYFFDIQKEPITAPDFFNVLRTKLNAIDDKAFDLDLRKFPTEARVARALSTAINLEIKNYLTKPNPEAFKKNCRAHIKSAKCTLDTHRGWTEILGNLGLLILGFGIGYLAVGLVHMALTKKKFLFFETDSANKVNELSAEIEGINHEKPPTQGYCYR